MRLLALGQAGFVLEGSNIAVAIDPYLSFAIENNGTALGRRFTREFPPPVAPQDLAHVAAVLITHAHDDHCDPATLVPLAAQAPTVRFIGPTPALDVLRSHAVDAKRCSATRVGETIDLGDGCIVRAVPAAHYGFDLDAEGEPAYVGFVVTLDGRTLYHAGDTVLYPGLAETLRPMRIDVALLPVNGRDAEREALGITGNLEPREAFELAKEIGASTVVPMHNDLFAINRRDPKVVEQAWRDTAADFQLRTLRAGEALRIQGSR